MTRTTLSSEETKTSSSGVSSSTNNNNMLTNTNSRNNLNSTIIIRRPNLSPNQPHKQTPMEHPRIHLQQPQVATRSEAVAAA